jgi:hypothetical protein
VGFTIRRTSIRGYDIAALDARSLRLYATVAAIPAVLVVVAHLAYAWNAHPGSADRRAAAFDHGIALAAILAAVLAAGRIALRRGRPGAAVADVAATVAAIAVLAHLASEWRFHSVGDISLLAEHVGALAVVAAAGVLYHRRTGRPRPRIT